MSPCLESVTSLVARITCKIHPAFWLSFCILQAIKNRSRGRPGNEATLELRFCTCPVAPKLTSLLVSLHVDYL